MVTSGVVRLSGVCKFIGQLEAMKFSGVVCPRLLFTLSDWLLDDSFLRASEDYSVGLAPGRAPTHTALTHLTHKMNHTATTSPDGTPMPSRSDSRYSLNFLFSKLITNNAVKILFQKFFVIGEFSYAKVHEIKKF